MKFCIFIVQNLKFICIKICAKFIALKKENEVSQLPVSLCYLLIYHCSLMICLFVETVSSIHFQIKSSIGKSVLRL